MTNRANRTNSAGFLEPSQIKAYLKRLKKEGASPATLKRKEAALKKFQSWQGKEYGPKYPLPKGAPKPKKIISKGIFPKAFPPFLRYFSFLIGLVLLTSLGWGVYSQFFAQPKETPSMALPTNPPLLISFQGQLTDEVGTPINATVSATFRLYNVDEDGTALWQEQKNVSTDQDGIFNTFLGDTATLDPAIFRDNMNLWLAIEIDNDGEMEPRQQIATVGYAFNSRYLQGYEATTAATAETIPVINADGDLILASSSPAIEATSGTFGLKGEAITIQSTGGVGGGDILIQPDADTQGQVIIYSATTADNSFTVQNSNITTGSLIYGEAGTSASGYNLLKLASGSPLTDKFVVDYAGNTDIAGNLTVDSSGFFGNSVGIGTTSPGATLDVNGDLRIGTLATGATNTVLIHNGNIVQQRTIDSRVWGAALVDYSGTSANYIPKMLDADTITNSLIYEAANGRIGISTTSPGSKLTVAGGASYFGALPAPTGVVATPTSGGGLVAGTYYYVVNAFDSNNLSSNKSSQVSCTVDGSATTACQISWVAVPGATNYRVYGRASNAQNQYWQTTSLYYTDTGAAGASDTPPGPISAFFTGNIKAERFADSANDTYYLDPAYATLSLTTAGAAGIGYSAGQMSGATAALAVSGNVGIGTTTPGQKLEVYGGHILVNGAGLTDPTIQFRDGTAVHWSLGMDDQSLGSGNPFIFSNGNGLGSPIMTLKSGNVGIGTTAPGAKLEVAGSTWLRSTAIPQIRLYTDTDVGGGNYAIIQNPSTDGTATLDFSVGGKANAVRIDNTGNVGIGTASPSYPLHVYKNAGDWTARFQNTSGSIDIGPANGSGAHIYTDLSQFFFNQPITLTGTSSISSYSTNNLYLKTGTQANTRMTILASNGNVGIGTTGPSQKLDVNGNIRLQGNTLETAGSSGTYGSVSISGSKGGYSGLHFPSTTPGSVFMVRNSDGLSGIWNHSTSSWAWYFDGNGTLATGTVPWTRLSGYPSVTAGNGLSGGGSLSGNVTLTVGAGTGISVGSTTVGLNLTYTDGRYLQRAVNTWHSSTDGTARLYFADSSHTYLRTGSNIYFRNVDNSTIFTVLSNGNVGIGTTGPGYKLDVSGTARFTGNTIIGSGSGVRYLEISSTNDSSVLGFNEGASGKYQLFYTPTSDYLELYGYAATKAYTRWYDNGNIYFNGNVGIGTTGPGQKLYVSGGKIGLDGGQQLVFSNADTTNNLKLQLWTGYGLGINSSTLFYAADGNHSWRDASGTNERMRLTTAAAGGLGIGTGTLSNSAKLHVHSSVENSQIRLTGPNTGTDAGGEISSNDATQIQISGGMYRNSSAAWVSRSTSGNASIGTWQGKIYFFGDTGKTVGNTFTPTTRMILRGDSSGVNVPIIASRANNADANTILEYYGAYNISMGVYSTGYYEYYTDSSNVARYLSWTGTAIDLAEWFPVGQESMRNGQKTLQKGDILCASPQDKDKVIACQKEYASTIVGAVSTQPWSTMGNVDMQLEMGQEPGDMVQNVIAGRVPLKVTTSNGPINKGDALTSSALTGIAQKSAKVGPTVGKAMEMTSDWNDSKCPSVSSLESIIWPDDDGTNPNGPCYKLPNGSYVGKIMALINISWYDPDVYLTQTGDIAINDADGNPKNLLADETIETQIANLKSQNYNLKLKTGETVERIANFAETATAKLKAGLIETTNLITENLVAKRIASEEKIISPVVETEQINLKTQNSKLKTTTQNAKLKIVNSEEQAIAEFDTETKNTTLFGNLEVAGNVGIGQEVSAPKANFGDLLTQKINTNEIQANTIHADTAQISADATISGTLYVDRVVARQGGFGELLAENISMDSIKSIVKEEVGILNSTQGGQASQDDGGEENTGLNGIENTVSTQDETGSGQETEFDLEALLAQVEEWAGTSVGNDLTINCSEKHTDTTGLDNAGLNGMEDKVSTQEETGLDNAGLNGNDGTSHSGLDPESKNLCLVDTNFTVLGGHTSLANTSIAGQLSVGNLVINNNSLDVLGGTLYIQKLAMGGLDILNGKLTVDTNGNVFIAAHLTVGGGLATNEIRPMEGGDITFNLDNAGLNGMEDKVSTQEETGLENAGFGKLLVKGINNETVASIDASGSAEFKKVSTDLLEINTNKEASQSGEVIIAAAENLENIGILAPGLQTNATAGEATLPAGEKEIIIYNDKLTDQSLVYLTPTADTENKILYVKEKKILNQVQDDGTGAVQDDGTGAVQDDGDVGQDNSKKTGYFVVGLNEGLGWDVRFNWWIIN